MLTRDHFADELVSLAFAYDTHLRLPPLKYEVARYCAPLFLPWHLQAEAAMKGARPGFDQRYGYVFLKRDQKSGKYSPDFYIEPYLKDAHSVYDWAIDQCASYQATECYTGEDVALELWSRTPEVLLLLLAHDHFVGFPKIVEAVRVVEERTGKNLAAEAQALWDRLGAMTVPPGDAS